MNILAFNSPEQDVIYDALIMHMQCTDDDSVADTCHTIINKMHMHSVMNEEQVWCIRYKELRMNQSSS